MKIFERQRGLSIVEKNLVKAPAFLRCSPLVLLIVLLHSFTYVAANTNYSDETFTVELEDMADGCPVEHYSGIKLNPLKFRSKRNTKKNGEKALGLEEVACDREGFAVLGYNFKGFFAYPTKTRTCRQCGTWSCAAPVCANRNDVSIEEINVVPMTAVLCTESALIDSCLNAKEKWVRAGFVHEECSQNVKDIDNVITQDILFTFARHVHLSFVTFELYDNASDFNIEIKVAPSDVIKEFSPEAQDFLSSHYERFRRVIGFRSADQCAVTQIGVYAKEVFIRFSMKKDEKSSAKDEDSYVNFRWRPRPRFYQVPDIDSRRKMAWYGAGCPERPTIKHAFVKHASKDSIVYACKTGYKLVDPVKNETSDGKLRCVNRFEWSPYPFPVCRPCLEDDANCQTPLEGGDTSQPGTLEKDDNGSMIGTKVDSSYERNAASDTEKLLPDSLKNLLSKGLNELKDSMDTIDNQVQHQLGVPLNWTVVATAFAAILLGFLTGLLVFFICHKKCVAVLSAEHIAPKRSPIVRPGCFATRGILHKDRSKTATYSILLEDSSVYAEKPCNVQKIEIPDVHQQCKRLTDQLF